ncbi:MAG: Sau3AI family type II restriction endonuclease [Melioribacteraceae bacterium]|nr:Sau3AI family type II restriction endonuclease [Melioribacteraceae bacterium]
MKFDASSAESIISFSKDLKGNTLRSICSSDIEEHGLGGKGNFGQLLEKFYFGYELNSNAEPDFAEADLELKTTPLKALKNGSFRSKERLVLNIIDYLKVYDEEFYNSSFWKKNSHLLIIFYLFEKELDKLDYRIPLVGDWKFPEKDLEIIKKDWLTIRQKIKEGKAHELSESDTFYLGACTKGSKGGNLRAQPFSTEKAKQRAYSLKQGYVNHIIAAISKDEEEEYGRLIDSLMVAKEKTIDQVVNEKFAPFINMNIDDLIDILGLDSADRKSKRFHSSLVLDLTRTIFDIPKNKRIEDHIEEFKKSDLKIKTVRLDFNDRPCEDISLPAFNYFEIYNGNWRDSRLKEHVERKYLFVFFQYDELGTLRLKKVQFWNMDHTGRQAAKKIWLDLKYLIMKGKIVQRVHPNGRRFTYFPSIKTFNIHIRPHATNSMDTYPLPVFDKVIGEKKYTKHSFWFNKDYIRDNIYYQKAFL